MHALQPKHSKLKLDELKELLVAFNISVSQLPKIKSTDSALPEGFQRGDVIKIERSVEGKLRASYRVVI